MSYSDQVLDHYENPRNVGRFNDEESEDIGTGMVGAPACGDVMRLQIKVNPKMELSKMLGLKPTDAEVLSRLPALLTEWVKGRSLDEAGKYYQLPHR